MLPEKILGPSAETLAPGTGESVPESSTVTVRSRPRRVRRTARRIRATATTTAMRSHSIEERPELEAPEGELPPLGAVGVRLTDVQYRHVRSGSKDRHSLRLTDDDVEWAGSNLIAGLSQNLTTGADAVLRVSRVIDRDLERVDRVHAGRWVQERGHPGPGPAAGRSPGIDAVEALIRRNRGIGGIAAGSVVPAIGLVAAITGVEVAGRSDIRSWRSQR